MSIERALVPARGNPAGRRPPLRSVSRSAQPPRAPFVVLVLLLLGVGLIGLLLLNTSLQQGSFVLEDLQAETAQLRDRQTMLADDVAARGAPDALAAKAHRLGMVTAKAPLFLELPGKVAVADVGGSR